VDVIKAVEEGVDPKRRRGARVHKMSSFFNTVAKLLKPHSPSFSSFTTVLHCASSFLRLDSRVGFMLQGSTVMHSAAVDEAEAGRSGAKRALKLCSGFVSFSRRTCMHGF